LKVRHYYVHHPNGLTKCILGCDGKIVRVVKRNVGSAILGWNDNLQNIFIDDTHFYSNT